MTDHLTPAQRHLVMSHIRSRNTKPELKVRQWLWRHGYRYRLNVKSVPGKPDIVIDNGWQVIVVWECQLTPKQIEQTMTEVELQLNDNFLSLHSKHTPFYYNTEEEHPLPMAAEELDYGNPSEAIPQTPRP